MPAGHTEFEGISWRVTHFHFHAPSENQIEGKSFPMEMQIVHVDDNLEGRNMVLSILFELGAQNQFLEELDWGQLPKIPSSRSEEETHPIEKPIHLDRMINNKNSALEYWSYVGSLTTPPCTEGVQWVVLAEPDHLDQTQLLSFYNALPHANFRTPQPIRSRKLQKNSAPQQQDESSSWGYEMHNGPITWPSAGFPACDYKLQSPIDIIPSTAQKHSHYALDWQAWTSTIGAMKLYMENDAK